MAETDYSEITKDELLKEATDRGLEVPSSAKKDEIIEALQKDDKEKIGAAAASDDEPEATVLYVGPSGLVCDALLPYQDDKAELDNGREYTAPVSVIRQVVLNGNFRPVDNSAKSLLDRERRRSNAGRLRAQRILAGGVASGETAAMYDQRVGIERDEKATTAASFRVERRGADELDPEFDPMAKFLDEEE
jgi:hypothetical protein